MKKILLLSLLFAVSWIPQLQADHHLAAKVYVIHGIPGQDLGLDRLLPVDVAVNDACTLTGFGFGEVAGPLTLEAGTYNVKIGVADPLNPCSNPPVIEADVPLAPGEVAVIVAHLAEGGAPTASKFVLDYTAAPDAQSRINLHHTADAPLVDIFLRNTPCSHVDQQRFSGVGNGAQAALVSPAKSWYFSMAPAMQSDSLIGPLEMPVGLSKAYHAFVVGSLNQDSLALMVFESPLSPGAPLTPVAAQVVVVHGIPGQDLGLPADLPVDISLNGTPVLTAFRFGEVTPPLPLAPGAYHIDISPANADNPGSETPVIQADINLHAGDHISVVAHLSESGSPTAGVFPNLSTECHPVENPILIHHLAAAPAVDVGATHKFAYGYRSSRPLSDVINGQQGVIDAEPGDWWINLYAAGTDHDSLASTQLTVDSVTIPSIYAVGSLSNNSLSLIENTRPRYATLEALALYLNQTGPYAGALDSLLTAVLTADPAILQALAGKDALTVFAPTDEAFAELGLTPETIPSQDPAFLTQVLLTHVVPGGLTAEEVLAANTLTTLEGSVLAQDSGVLTDPRGRQAAIVVTDLNAGNGVIHVIDAVILPPEPKPSLLDLTVQLNAEGPYAGVFDTLIAAVLAADPLIASALSGDGPLTVFAPTDDAFAALGLTPDAIGNQDPAFLTDVLLTHVVSGRLSSAQVLAQESLVTLQGSTLMQLNGVLTDPRGRSATITVTDVHAANGVIHVIDAVVLPAEAKPSLLDLTLQLNGDGPYAGTFDTLIAAVLAADPMIVAALTGDDPLTVFAPTDEAFAALDLNPDNINSLGQPLLTDILLYHVSAGKQLAADVLGQTTLPMLKGGSLLQNGGVLTDNLGRSASIIVTDVEAANGVIHVINAVVLPVAP